MDDFAGKCGTRRLALSGHRLSDLRLEKPNGVAHDRNITAFISLLRDQKIVIIEDDMVKEVISLSVRPVVLEFDSLERSLYLTFNHGLAMVDLSSMELTVVVGSTNNTKQSSPQTMPLDDVMFRYPSHFTRLSVNHWVMTDSSNRRSVTPMQKIDFTN